MKSGDIVKRGGKEYLVIGKTFGTKTRLPAESIVEVEAEQANLERDEDGNLLALTLWAPEVMGKAEGKPETLDTVVNRARKHGVLREKVRRDGEIEYLPNVSGEPATADKAGIEDYPDEDKKLRYVFQLHARGKSVHGDLRVEFKRGKEHYLKGWTIALQQPGAIKEPITTLAQLKKAAKNPDLWKMDLKTGLVKPRRIRGGTVRRGDLRAFPKGVEIPSDWLHEEGVTDKPDPGEPVPVGATREFPGVFLIVSKGDIEFGSIKPWFTEMFLDGDWKGRWAFRLVQRKGDKWYTPECEEDMKEFNDLMAFWEKADVLPPGVEEEDARTESYVVLMQPKSQVPYVLSKEAIEESWLPPKGISALPKKIRVSVPKELRYWEQGRKQALESRRKLAEEFEELGGPDLKQRTIKFILTRRDWKGQPVIRAGASTVVWDLWVDGWRLALSGDPLKKDEVAAQPATAGDRIDGKRVRDMDIGDTVDVKPGSKFNPTKETPCMLEVLDKGDALELTKEKAHRKYQFKGDELKGTWFFRAEDEPSGFWLMSKSEGPDVKKVGARWATLANGRRVPLGANYPPKAHRGGFNAMKKSAKDGAAKAIEEGRRDVVEANLRVVEKGLKERERAIARHEKNISDCEAALRGKENLAWHMAGGKKPNLKSAITFQKNELKRETKKYWEEVGIIEGGREALG